MNMEFDFSVKSAITGSSIATVPATAPAPAPYFEIPASFSEFNDQGGSTVKWAIIGSSIVVVVLATIVAVIFAVKRWRNKNRTTQHAARDTQFVTISMEVITDAVSIDKFLNDMEREKFIMFTSDQLKTSTDNFSHEVGSGGFGTVYKGVFGNGTKIAVKVLNGNSDKRIEEQFMAEVGTIGRTHHINLVRLVGFCSEGEMRALVYEFMSNGSLDKYLFNEENKSVLGFEKLHEISVGTARGIAYLHEECKERIIHYDIKPENILLDDKFCPKVSDFGLAKLLNREKSHITMAGARGTPGYAAPELWMPSPITYKCDVYSFGMLLFEIVGRRRNLDINLPESQEWFPRFVWDRFGRGKMGDLRKTCGIEKKDKVIAERMMKVALLCVNYKPKMRPMMSTVVKMLEGLVEIPKPSNPFRKA